MYSRSKCEESKRNMAHSHNYSTTQINPAAFHLGVQGTTNSVSGVHPKLNIRCSKISHYTHCSCQTSALESFSCSSFFSPSREPLSWSSLLFCSFASSTLPWYWSTMDSRPEAVNLDAANRTCNTLPKHTTPYYTTLHHTTRNHTTPHHSTSHLTTPHHTPHHHPTPPHPTPQWSTLISYMHHASCRQITGQQ